LLARHLAVVSKCAAISILNQSQLQMISAKEKAILVVSFSNDAHWSMQLNICNKTCALSAKKKLLQQSQIQFHVCVKPCEAEPSQHWQFRQWQEPVQSDRQSCHLCPTVEMFVELMSKRKRCGTNNERLIFYCSQRFSDESIFSRKKLTSIICNPTNGDTYHQAQQQQHHIQTIFWASLNKCPQLKQLWTSQLKWTNVKIDSV